MNATTPPGDHDLTPELIMLLEPACDRFEAAWRAGERPALEDYLATMPAEGRLVLFQELAAIELVYRCRGGERPEPDEYRARFPEWRAAVDASFAAMLDHAGQPPCRVLPRSAMPREACDRNLLFGVLALQMDLIGRDALIGAVNVWGRHKDASLASILVAQGAIDPHDRVLLEPIVARHIHLHGDDPARSLAALRSVTTARELLEAVDDLDIRSSLTWLGSGPAPGANRHDPAEEATAPGPTDGDGETSRARMPAGNVTRAGGRFRILRPHDRGALGVVYVARDQELHREVALKQIKDEHADDAQRRARFLVEAEITGRLEHPGIVPVYGLGQDDNGRPFYAMRFVRGDNLKNAIESFHSADTKPRDPGARVLELRRLLGRFLDVCNAVAYAHSRGILHRDLKPGNIMLGEYGETLVVDWGVAKAIGQVDPAGADVERKLTPESGSEVKSTETGAQVGTPAFMSPEQAAGRHGEVSPASDVYSLGATLYCLLTGKPPFGDRELVELLRKVERGEFAPPRAVAAHIDRGLDAICRKAMALRPEDRYGSPRALADDIEHWLADEPVSALPESAGQRLARWARRNWSWMRAGAMAGVAVVAMALALTLAVLVLFVVRGLQDVGLQRSRQQRAADLQQRLKALEQRTQPPSGMAPGKSDAGSAPDARKWEQRRAEPKKNNAPAPRRIRPPIEADRDKRAAAKSESTVSGLPPPGISIV
jgi:tRNA A-37 threonylcarbamoyl transferase component Bud32